MSQPIFLFLFKIEFIRQNSRFLHEKTFIEIPYNYNHWVKRIHLLWKNKQNKLIKINMVCSVYWVNKVPPSSWHPFQRAGGDALRCPCLQSMCGQERTGWWRKRSRVKHFRESPQANDVCSIVGWDCLVVEHRAEQTHSFWQINEGLSTASGKNQSIL